MFKTSQETIKYYYLLFSINIKIILKIVKKLSIIYNKINIIILLVSIQK